MHASLWGFLQCVKLKVLFAGEQEVDFPASVQFPPRLLNYFLVFKVGLKTSPLLFALHLEINCNNTKTVDGINDLKCLRRKA